MFKLKFNPKKEWQCISTLKLNEIDWNRAKFYHVDDKYLSKVNDWIIENTNSEFEIGKIKLENHLFGLDDTFISRDRNWMIEFVHILAGDDNHWISKVKIYKNNHIENKPEIKKILL